MKIVRGEASDLFNFGGFCYVCETDYSVKIEINCKVWCSRSQVVEACLWDVPE